MREGVKVPGRTKAGLQELGERPPPLTWKTAASEELGRWPSIPMCMYRRLSSSGISAGAVPSLEIGKCLGSVRWIQLYWMLAGVKLRRSRHLRCVVSSTIVATTTIGGQITPGVSAEGPGELGYQ